MNVYLQSSSTLHITQYAYASYPDEQSSSLQACNTKRLKESINQLINQSIIKASEQQYYVRL